MFPSTYSSTVQYIDDRQNVDGGYGNLGTSGLRGTAPTFGEVSEDLSFAIAAGEAKSVSCRPPRDTVCTSTSVYIHTTYSVQK